jgi:hypothetical protein
MKILNIQNKDIPFYIIDSENLNEKKMSSFLKELYNLKKKCFFKKNETYNKINGWINNSNSIQFTIFKLKHIIREYLNECKLNNLFTTIKQKINGFSNNFKLFIYTFLFSEASSVSIGCKKKNQVIQNTIEKNNKPENRPRRVRLSRHKNIIFKPPIISSKSQNNIFLHNEKKVKGRKRSISI